MATPKETLWELDPHTAAKHEILRRYLQAWFPILNTYHDRIVYVDGFAGPGRYRGGEVGSPVIALDVAMNHRKVLEGELVFRFVDECEDRIAHLRQELDGMDIPPHFDVCAEAGRFNEKVGPILDLLDNDRALPAPTFSFSDPFGFSGIPFSLIERLLNRRRS